MSFIKERAFIAPCLLMITAMVLTVTGTLKGINGCADERQSELEW